ncbi:aminotransferase class V-fold PLP-dependent enzyme [Allokutzneria sp. A3M-2-11 16]|uniref:pyridoxal phosphate-dependent decarboxylase family protein n=1 Tax=Allokutzneria sp. A3M-2-11 16 TaxID=2962043 RepID=UPI0020B6D207|nr:aminotransferase class V-fold PLP-dependent enzyme [Allokutzneria sp. A3M-2-11 16]MCP3805158.1 aminotransferase class V-fold PLP-dependent enzyme [Allokutzneria sp. A3M-2-11 16]
MIFESWDPDRAELAAMMAGVGELAADFLEGLPSAPASNLRPRTKPFDPPSEKPGEFAELLEIFKQAAGNAVETAGPGYLAYFPVGGLVSSALGEFLSLLVNRFTGVASMAPDLVAMEDSVVDWLCREFALPASAGGFITTGGSLATLSAVVAARQSRLGEQHGTGTIYVTEHTHLCVAKAARIAGLRPDQLRVVPVTEDHRMDPEAAEDMIAKDPAPFLLVGTAGSTSTGTVDPLDELAAIAERHGMWFHVDGAYGGGFQLTERGRAKLRGIERADSITIDPHKTMFLPYGTGVLLVRDQETLRAAHTADASYLQDLQRDPWPPDYCDFGPELTREFRGLRMWLPLHLHGVAAFRRALDQKLDLAQVVHRELSALSEVDVPVHPDLTVNVFRLREGGDEENRRLLEQINATERVFLSSTRLRGEYLLRLCVLSHRTEPERVAEALSIVRSLVR